MTVDCCPLSVDQTKHTQSLLSVDCCLLTLKTKHHD